MTVAPTIFLLHQNLFKLNQETCMRRSSIFFYQEFECNLKLSSGPFMVVIMNGDIKE